MIHETMSAALIQAAQQIEEMNLQPCENNKRKDFPGMTPIAPAPTVRPLYVPVGESSTYPPKAKRAKKVPSDRSRALRLEQNRKAARESRRRKKAMVEELQRSLVFFSKSNAALKQENEELTRQVVEAQNMLAKIGEPLPKSNYSESTTV